MALRAFHEYVVCISKQPTHGSQQSHANVEHWLTDSSRRRTCIIFPGQLQASCTMSRAFPCMPACSLHSPMHALCSYSAAASTTMPSSTTAAVHAATTARSQLYSASRASHAAVWRRATSSTSISRTRRSCFPSDLLSPAVQHLRCASAFLHQLLLL